MPTHGEVLAPPSWGASRAQARDYLSNMRSTEWDALRAQARSYLYYLRTGAAAEDEPLLILPEDLETKRVMVENAAPGQVR